MSKKHMIVFADAIASISDKTERDIICATIGHVVASLNPQFSWSKWRAACRCEGGVK